MERKTQVKKWYKSKTLWATVVSIIIGLAPFIDQVKYFLPPEVGLAFTIIANIIIMAARVYGNNYKLIK